MKGSDKVERGHIHAKKNERNASYRNQKVFRVIATRRWSTGRLRTRNATLRNEAARRPEDTSLEHAKTLNTIEIARTDFLALLSPLLTLLSYWWRPLEAEITFQDKLMLHASVTALAMCIGRTEFHDLEEILLRKFLGKGVFYSR